LEQVRTAVARELDLLDVIRAAVDGIAATFGYQQVSIYLLQHDTLVLQYQIGYPQVIARLPVTQGVMGFVARTGEPVLIEDVGTDARFLAAFPGITSEVCVPICDETQTVGVLNVESVGDVRLGHADLCFMRAQPTH
jgi:putative methionine-R-sulfoxide reductase with GAF domain